MPLTNTIGTQQITLCAFSVMLDLKMILRMCQGKSLRLRVENTFNLSILPSMYQLCIHNYNAESVAVILKRQTSFKLISRYHPFIRNAMNVV